MEFSQQLFLVLAAALVGGISVRFLRLQPIVGYTLAGVIFGVFLGQVAGDVERLAALGAILLLFSIGIELSWARLSKVFRVAVLGGVLGIFLVSLIGYFGLLFFGFSSLTALILSLGFSLSSTALVVKILGDRGETDTIFGEVMIGWLLVQDLITVPILVIITAVAKGQDGLLASSLSALLTSGIVILATLFLGKWIVPFFIRKVAGVNSRELLLLSAIALALGVAALTSSFGISPILGAFLAGVVIAESDVHQAIFAEIRPLRDVFVALFFVTLGFLVTPSVILSNLLAIAALAAFVLVSKFVVTFLLSLIFGYHGKTAVAIGVGLAQVGEFSFIIFSQAKSLGLISSEATSIGIAVALATIIATPLLFKAISPLWKKLKEGTRRWPKINKAFLGWDKKSLGEAESQLSGHIIICGYGRVGGWVGKALRDVSIPFVVIDYNQKVVSSLKEIGEDVIYGDPSEPEVLESAGIKTARVIVIAVPDRVVSEALVAHVQTVAPSVKIITRAHFDEDWDKLKALGVDKIIQPEFEAAIAIIKMVLTASGKSKEEVGKEVKSVRLSRSARG